MKIHPITAESFAIIDGEIGQHHWSPEEYAIVRRAIHATADFEFNHLLQFSPHAIAAGIQAIQRNAPVIVDVRMVAVAVRSTLKQAGLADPLCALDYEGSGSTRTAAGMKAVARQHPEAVIVVGNAPTALLALVELIQQELIQPSCVIGVPVGFVAVEAAKIALSKLPTNQILVRGRKGGSPVAAAILNALVHLAINP